MRRESDTSPVTVTQTVHRALGPLVVVEVGTLKVRLTPREAHTLALALFAVRDGRSAETELFMCPIASDPIFVARVETDPKGTQAQLSAALAPVADRLLRRYRSLQGQRAAAEANHDAAAAQAAKDALDALVLFKGDMGAYTRLYAFLSQIFDYGNTDVEKRFIFYRLLIPLLDFGREREKVDLSKLVMMCLDNGGKLSKHRRKQFQYSVAEEVFGFIEEESLRLMGE